ncbi:cell wall-active antibiotics response protein LiaF [Oceanobacillus jeddahense]|uniref:Cell wall-active antibiotics response protein LiaF n=1 Tax=Oceanobacillus jeddahense TaxID=1462527 RepID=A0ABY5JLS4_9BACI|nr:cell wall-active antibiotics response protein LiaF [Oceanobacillus jeddahense]UUI01245.1 cell wall-active antibiotics response protein LiaF [Oceanobacillus jeddahense]
MFKQLSTRNLNWIWITVAILLVFEIVFFHGGSLISAFISGFFVYFSWKRLHSLGWKIVFAIAVISFILNVFNLLAVRFLIVVAIVVFILNYVKSTKEPSKEEPELPNKTGLKEEDPLIQVDNLFDERFFDDFRTEETAYQWKDVNMHGIYGDRIIDLSNTVLPYDTAVISIRHIVGNIEIYVPYEVEVSIHHSSIFGRASIFGEYHGRLMNKSLHYETKNYSTAQQRVKIVTSLFSGDIEVKRI